MRVRGNEKNRGGFSLAEVLIVVAILGILLAIALPNVLAAYRQLRLTELDDSARTIFVAAQNQLSALVAQGRDLKSAVGGEELNLSARAAGGGPATPATQTLYFISNDDSLHSSDTNNDSLHNILAGLSIDNELQLHNYVIEYCPETGAVYAVWYWEDAKFDYSKEAYKPFSSDKNARLKSGRLIGYYGGDKIDRTPYGQLPLPKVELINAEELRLRIGVPGDGVPGALDAGLRVDVKVNGKSIIEGAKVQTLHNSGDNYYTVVLDTLHDQAKYPASNMDAPGLGWTYGKRFCEWTDVNNKPLSATPGEDITVTVVLWYEGTGNYLPQIVRVTGNSLFASVWETTEGKKVANIAYGRHLQNLDEGDDFCVIPPSTVSVQRPGSGVTGIKQATQIRDINFAMPNPNSPNNKEDDVYYWASTYPNKKFQTIYNVALAAYDGQQFEIRNINITDLGGFCGLFNVPLNFDTNIEKLVIEDVTLVNATLYNSVDKGYLGGLVASDYVSSLTIKGCKIYNEYDKNKSDPESVKELLEDVNFSLNDLKVDENDPVYKKLLNMPGMIAINSTYAGGFVGTFGPYYGKAELSIQNSSISTVMIGDSIIGGLLGNAGGGSQDADVSVVIKNVYCSNFLCGTSSAGGMIGMSTAAEAVDIEDCYVTGEIMNGNNDRDRKIKGAGLSTEKPGGSTTTFTLARVYSAVRYVNPERFSSIYGTIESPSGNQSDTVFYLPQSGVTYNVGVIGAGNEISESDLRNLTKSGSDFTAANGWYVPPTAGAGNPAGVTFPYQLLSELKKDDSLTIPYPYPMLLAGDGTDPSAGPEPHYGDWLENNSNLFLLYYEKYKEGGYGFYSAAVEPDGANAPKVTALVNTLKAATPGVENNPLVVDDGYLLVSAINMDGQKYSVDGTEAATGLSSITTLDTEMENALKPLDILKDITGGLHVYTLDFGSDPIKYYTTVEVGGRSFAVNPHFACEAFDVTEDPMPPTNYDKFYDKPGVAGIGTTDGNPVPLPGVTDGTTDTKNVVIRSPRHLVNLSKYTRDNSVSAKAQTWDYIQLLDVDFDAWEKDLAGKSDTNRLYPIRLRDGGSYTGNRFRIENIYIGPENGTDTLVGLFDEVSGTTKLEGIRMHNASVKADNATVTAVGGLVGKMSGGTVTDCGIYVDRDKYIYKPGEPADTDLSVKNNAGNPVGGLIGQITGGTVENSFAAVKLYSGSNGTCGGFVGEMTGGTVTNCYAGGHTVNGKYVDISDGYNVSAGTGGTAGGFVGEYAGGTFGGICYSTCSADGVSVGQFAGKVSTSSGTIPVPAGVILYGIGLAHPKDTTGAAVTEEPYLTGKTAALQRSKTDFQTHPYDAALYAKRAGSTDPDYTKPLTFPYNTNLQEHYGDWVEPLMACYVERYADDPAGNAPDYGVYSAQVDSADANGIKAAMNTLAGERLVVADGYFLLSAVELTLDPNSDLERVENSSNNKVIDDDILKVGDEEYYVYTFRDDKQPLREDGNYYTAYTYNGDQYYFNFDLACEAFAIAQGVDPGLKTVLKKPDAKAQGDSDDVEGAAIRSARQLAQLGINTNDGTKTAELLQGLHYTQLVCVNYDKYEPDLMPKIKTSDGATYNHVPITLTKDAEYNGTGHTVRNVKPGTLVDGTLAESGLFGHVSDGAKLKEIVLINAKVEVTDSSAVMSNGEVTTPTGTHVLNAADVNVDSNSKTFSKEVNGIKFEGFTVGKNSENGANFVDSYAGKAFFELQGKMEVSGGTPSKAIKFEINKPTILKVWWSRKSEGSNNEKKFGIKEFNGTSLGATVKEISNKEGSDTGVISEFELTKSGIYCLGGIDDGARIYKIEVITGPSTVEGNKPTGAAMPSDGVYVGALAGLVDGSAIVKNCGVYVDEDPYNASYDKIDSAYGHFQVSNIKAPNSAENEGVGGLLGRADGAEVSTCFAAVKVTGVHFVGGFVGSLSGGTVENCYAGGHTVNGSYQTYDSTTRTATPVINILATDKDDTTDGADTGVGGFAGLVNGDVTFTGTNYTTCSVALENSPAISAVSGPKEETKLDDDQVNRVTEGTSIGMFFGRVKVDAKVTTDDAINYATGTLFVKGESVKRNATFKTPENIVVYAWDDTAKKWEKSEKQNIQYVTADEVYTNQYVTMLDPRTSATKDDASYDSTLGNVYPYELAGDQPHHGDWTERLNLVYYEVYDENRTIEVENLKSEDLVKAINDNKIGFYGELRGGRVINTLNYGDDVIVYDSGYMVVNNHADLGPLDIQLRSYYSKAGETNKNHYNSETIMKSVKVTGATGLDWAQYVYVIPFSVLNIAPSDHYYMLAFVNGVSYVFNPHFAGEAVNVGILTKEQMKTSTNLDNDFLKNIRVKPEFADAGTGTGAKTGVDGIVIRTSWNFSSLARYCRPANNGKSQEIVRKASIVQQMNLDFSEDNGYRQGRVYDGNDHNRFRMGSSGAYEYRAGANYAHGHAPVFLEGGSYDGQNHTISNIYLTNDSSGENNYAGLFVLKGAQLKDLDVENVWINSGKLSEDKTTGMPEEVYAGGIAAYMEGDKASITNVTIKDVRFDFHLIPVYKGDNDNKDQSKWEYNSYNKVPLKAVGGAVGMIKGGALDNVLVSGVTMTFDGSNDISYYGVDHEGTGDDAKLTKDSLDVQKHTSSDTTIKENARDGQYAPSAIKDENAPISIGGAIGEIKSEGTNVSVNNVTVTDPLIKANMGTGNSVGGFVGKADGGEFKNYSSSVTGTGDDTRTVTITNSGVYLSEAKKSNFDQLDVVGVKSDAKGDDTVGGFAGQLGVNVAVEGDYSAIRVQGGKFVGGFAGKITGSHVKDCYSGGHTVNQAYEVDNYNVVGSGSSALVGGFAGSIDMGFQTGSSGNSALYMTGINYTTSSAQAAGATSRVGKFVGDTNTDELLTKMGDLKPTNYATGAVKGTTKTKDDITVSVIPDRDTTSAFGTYPYDTHLTGEDYPYGTNLSAHHGDWPDTVMTSGIAYWDKMEINGVTEFRVQVAGIDVTAKELLYNNNQIYSNLCDETHMQDGTIHDHKIVASGYALFSSGKGAQDRLGNLTAQVTGLIETTHTDDSGIQQAVSQALAAMCPDKNVSGAVIRVYNTPETGKADAQTLVLYDSTSAGKKVYYTAGFGGVSYDKEFGKDEGHPFLIRTLQQLDNIPDNTNAFFQQGHDLYGKDYGTTFTGAKNFSGGYDGRGYRVLDLDISTKDSGKNAALFESVSGSNGNATTLQGIILFNRAKDGGSITSGGSVAAGIVASVSGDVKMKNCAVAGYVFDKNSVTGTDGAVGPLVGVVESGGKLTVETSQAVNTFNGISAQSVGGLVGRADGEVASMTLCYAGGQVTMASGLDKYSVGGLVGRGTVKEVKQCYAYMDMSRLTITKDAANNLYMDPNGNMRVYALAPVTVSGSDTNIDWQSCRYLGRGLPEGAAMENAAAGYGYGSGLPLYDAKAEVLNEDKTATVTATITKSLGTWLGEQHKTDQEMGEPVNMDATAFPFQAVMKFGGKFKNNFYHYGETKYPTFGQRPTFGIFLVYGSSGDPPGVKDNNSPYYLFGVTETGTGKALLKPTIGGPTGSENLKTAYGLMLPKGYKVENTEFIFKVDNGIHHQGGSIIEYDTNLAWIQHNYRISDTNGNEIIGNFTVKAKDGKPMAIYQPGATNQDYTIEAPSDAKPKVKEMVKSLLEAVPIKTENITNKPSGIEDYSLFYFTVDSIAGMHGSEDAPTANRKRGNFIISFSYDGTEEIEVHLPEGDDPYQEENYYIGPKEN